MCSRCREPSGISGMSASARRTYLNSLKQTRRPAPSTYSRPCDKRRRGPGRIWEQGGACGCIGVRLADNRAGVAGSSPSPTPYSHLASSSYFCGRRLEDSKRAVFAEAHELAVDEQQRRAAHVRFAPHHLAGLPFDAAQLGLGGVVAARSVKIALVFDRRVPMKSHRLIAAAIAVVPHFHELCSVEADDGAADLVGFGDEYLVADDDGRRGVDAFELACTPREFGNRLPFLGVDRQQAVAGEHEDDVAAGDFGGNRTGIAGEVVAGLPADCAGRFVERDDGGTVGVDLAVGRVNIGRAAGRAAADVDEQQVVPNERRAADAEKVFHDVELFGRIDPPHGMAVGDADALQHAFGAERVNVWAIDDRRCPRAVVVAEHVDEIGGVVAGPLLGAGFGVEALELRGIFDSREVKQPAVADRRRRVAGADGLLPNDRRAFWRPGRGQSVLIGFAVAVGAQKTGPIGGRFWRRRFWRRGRHECLPHKCRMATELQGIVSRACMVACGCHGVIMRRTARGKETTMSCSKDKPIRKAKPGEFRCKDCGVVAKKKKNLCSPKKVKG